MRGLPDPSLLSSFRGFIFSEPFYPFKEARRYCAPIVSRVTVVVSPLGSPLLPQSRLSRFRGFCRSRGVRTRRAGELVVFGGFSEAPPCFCVLLFRSTTGKRFLGLADSPRNFTASAKQQACTPEGAFLPSKQEEGSVGLLQAGRKRRSDDLLSSSALDLFKNRISPLFRGGERDWDAGGVSTSPEASSSCYISQSFHSHSSFAPYLSFSFLCCQWPRFPYSPNSCLPLWTSCPLVEGRQPFTSFSFSLSSFEFYNFPCLLSRVEWCRGCPFRGGKPHCKKESISPSCLIHPRSISSPCPSPPTSFDPFTLMPSVAVPGPCTPSTDPLSTPASQPRTYPLSPLTTDCGGDSPAFLSQVPPTEVGVLSPSPRTHAETAVVVVSNQQAPALPTTLRGTEISPFQVGKVEVASCVPTATPPVTQPVHSYQTPREVALASPTCIPPPSFSGPFYVHAQQPGGPYTTPVLTAAGCGDTVQAYPFFSPRPGFSFPPAESSLRQQQAPVACVYTRTGTAPIALASPNTDIPIRTYDSSPHLTTTGSGVLRGQQAHSPPPPAPYNVNGRYWPSSSSGSGEGSQVAVAAHALPPVETGEPAAVCGPAIQNLVATDVGRGVPQGYNTTNDTIKRELWAAPQAAYAPAPVFGTPAPDCVLSSPQQHAQAVVHPAAPHVTPSFSPGLPPTTVNPSSCTPFPGGSPSSLAPGVPVRTLYKTEVLAGSPVVPAPAAVYRKHINLGNAIGAVTGRRSASYLACAPQPAVMADPSTRTMEKTGASSRSTKVTRHSQVPPASPAARQPRKLVATTPSPQKSPTKESPTYDVFNSVVSSTQQVEELHDRRRRIGDTGPSPELIREKLHKVMDVPNNFLKSARASFRQFDADGDGYLTFEDLRRLIERLCRNLQLPPVDDSVLRVIFEAFDSERRQKLNVEEFCRLYWELLGRIRDKFYPTRKMLVRRSVFVGRRNLDITQTSIEELFDFKKKLGAGAFGDVHLVVERSSGLERVIKTINKDRSQVPMEQIEAEIQVLKSLDHPNIIKIFEVFEDHHNMYIVMETCEGGELLERIVSAQARGKSLSERYVAELMKQMMNALAYFHSQHVVHKDLKPENVLFQDKSPQSPIKIIDFGLAELFKSDKRSKNAAGTALYMAPEVFQRDVTIKCDIWSAGVVLYFLLSGCLPFNGTSLEEVQHKVTYEEPNYEKECHHLTPEAIDLIKKMLTKDPDQRPSASEILKHEWFKQANTRELQISPLICENMKRYMRQSHLKNALVNLMAHQLNVTGQQIRHINQIFRQLDKNGDGLLSHQELTEGLLEAGVARWDINRILQSIDVDDSGNVSYTEFLAACYSWQETELNVVWTAFQKIDKDGDGKISVREFCDMVLGHDNKLIPEEDMEELVAQMDKNGDGLIDWDEFVAYMRQDET